MSHYPPKSFTKREREIARQLADPNVNQRWAAEWIEARKLEVQAMWSERERQTRCGESEQRVETTVIRIDRSRKRICLEAK
jgi:hypothetical protein